MQSCASEEQRHETVCHSDFPCRHRLRGRRRRAITESVRRPFSRSTDTGRSHRRRLRLASARLACAGTLRGARAPRHRRYERSVGSPGRRRDTPAGGQCNRRGGCGGSRARRHFSKRHWHRRRSLRAGVVRARQEVVRAELRRLGTCRMDAAVLHRKARSEDRPRVGSEFSDGTRRNLGLRRAAQALRQHDLRTDIRARGAHRRGRLGTGRASPRRSAKCHNRTARGCRFASDISDRRSRTGAVRHHPQSCARKGASSSAETRPRRFLSRRHRCRHRRKGASEWRCDDEKRPRGIPIGMGRADFDDLSRVRRVRAAAARAGIRCAADAQYSRGVRTEAGRESREAGPVEIRCIGT